jgi:hypothetical protein
MAKENAGDVRQVEDYTFPMIWQFSVDSQEAIDAPPVTNADGNAAPEAATFRSTPQKKHSKTICILAKSMDSAFAVLREKHPYVRVRNVERHSLPIHYIVDDVLVAQTIHTLTK